MRMDTLQKETSEGHLTPESYNKMFMVAIGVWNSDHRFVVDGYQ
jgi:hypothetical protein